MNTELLLALGLALGVGVVVALLLRSRQRQDASTRQAARTASAAVPAAQPAEVAARQSPEAAQVDAQRQATTEALRLARQRKAEEAARLEAERAVLARAEAAARALPRPPLPARPPPAAQLPNPPARAPAATAERTRPVLSPLAIHTSTPGPAKPAPSTPGLAPLSSAQPPRQPLVLLADDSKVVRVKTGRLLEKQGWRVLLVEDGAAALQALDSHAPDLLITDVEMPGLDGFALTRRVRAHPRFAHLPVIMITSSDERHRAEASAAGVNLLMGKPYAEEALLAQVQVMLAAAAQRAEPGLVMH